MEAVSCSVMLSCPGYKSSSFTKIRSERCKDFFLSCSTF